MFPVRLMVIASLLYPISAYERFHKDTLRLDSLYLLSSHHSFPLPQALEITSLLSVSVDLFFSESCI